MGGGYFPHPKPPSVNRGGWVSWEGDTSPTHVRRVLWARGNLPLPIYEASALPLSYGGVS